MRTKIYSILAMLLIFVSTSSCDDYLDLRPQDGIVRQEFWKTKEDVNAAVIGIYASLLSSPASVADKTPLSDYLFSYGELRADMLAPGVYVSPDQRDMMTTNILSTNTLTSWAAFYRVINYCNTVIDLAPAVLAQDPTLTQKKLNNYLSEALAIRAYMYFTLARTFRDVPLKLTATLTDKDNFQLATSPQSEIFAQVIKDLTLAEQYAVEDFGNIASNKGRITVYTINAMQTDVYLWTENYEAALTAANKVINSGKFSLVPISNAWFSRVYAQGNSSESIFEFQYTNTNLNSFYSMFYQFPEFTAGSFVLEDVFGLDFDHPENVDPRGNNASMIAGTNEIYKFTALNADQRKSIQESNTHWFVYRYTDVLLMKAEALAELGKGAEALVIIDDIRLQRKAIKLTEQTVDPLNKFDVIDYVLAERAREFAFEGKRWFDVLRNAKKNNYERLDILLDMALTNAPPDKQQSILAKLRDPNSHYLPINDFEMYSNKALVQNPFYK
ncbi:MAG: RagB/SusD family nutrient uptake outer membrane protein [Crocinitomicaceae bacterium]|nr:RagB/SusD family nutrient uptake outer membrane protein [Crocinitomicaceae bacterium]